MAMFCRVCGEIYELKSIIIKLQILIRGENGMLKNDDNKLIYSLRGETVTVEPWGENAFRVRATKKKAFSEKLGALTEAVENINADISVSDAFAEITNGGIKAKIDAYGKITFFNGNNKILEEFYRIKTVPTTHINSLHLAAREYVGISRGAWEINLRFESNDSERLFGMGQYQQPYLDLAGCTLELVQRNGQITVPFVLSSLGYGFLWNTPASGKVTFGKNLTEWHFNMEEEIDYYICVGSTPAEIVETYTAAVGRAPEMPENLLGLWQSKLRYASQQEVLSVAEEYKRRGIPLDVIVIDYIHWTRFGNWEFDREAFPNPDEMTQKLIDMGIKPMVSVWPALERSSKNYTPMLEKGYLVDTDKGLPIHTDFYNLAYFDVTNSDARDYVWEQLKNGYVKHGIKHFWLDCAEPEFRGYHLDNYRYSNGNTTMVANEYPKYYTKMVWDGLKAEGEKEVVSLVRSAWTGSQKYGALVWSGDIESTFDALKNQVQAGINMGICGFPWWTTDTGGFMHGDIDSPAFQELLVRWFEYSTFCPILRMHGDRQSSKHVPDGTRFFAPNEIWSYGEEVYCILKKYVELRESLKGYIKEKTVEASETGAPIIRAMFYEFPNDSECWKLSTQYMFGDKYLVAPILEAGAVKRELYLPNGSWKNIHTNEIITGGRFVNVNAPIDVIPVFERL